MVDVPLPLLALAFLLGGAFLYLGINYLNLNQSQDLYREGLDKLSLANDACAESQFELCMQALLESKAKLVEARSKINRDDSSMSDIYVRVGSTIEEIDVLLAFVPFSMGVGSLGSVELFAATGSVEPCELSRQAASFLDGARSLEADAQTLQALLETTSISEASQQMVHDTIVLFQANQKRIAALQPALEATCTIQTQIEPKIDLEDDSATFSNLRGDTYLPVARTKLSDSLRSCQQFAADASLSRVLNFTIEDCSWIQANLDSVDDLIRFLSSDPGTGSTGSGLFVTLKGYSDLLTIVDPVNDAVRVKATEIARDYPGGQSQAQAEALFRYVRDEIVYLSPPLTLQQRVQRPQTTLELKAGNCADKAVLAASLYMAIGYQVKIVLQDRLNSPAQIAAGATFAPDHSFVRVKVGDVWRTAEVTCSNCQFDTYTSVATSTLLEMDVPVPS